MQALILAGGAGARLRPYTTVIPKPLMPIGDYPILEILIRQLKQTGVTDVVLAVGYMSHLFEALFGDGEKYGLRIAYSFESKPLGTAGPISLLIDRLDDDFLLMNGDLLTTMRYDRLFHHHKEVKAAATLGIYRREVQVDFGIIESDQEGTLVNYIEKPIHSFDVSMGVYALNKKKIEPFLVREQHLDLPELMLKLRENNLKVNCYRQDCFWLDIGRIDDYQLASEVFEKNRSDFLPDESQ